MFWFLICAIEMKPGVGGDTKTYHDCACSSSWVSAEENLGPELQKNQ